MRDGCIGQEERTLHSTYTDNTGSGSWEARTEVGVGCGQAPVLALPPSPPPHPPWGSPASPRDTESHTQGHNPAALGPQHGTDSCCFLSAPLRGKERGVKLCIKRSSLYRPVVTATPNSTHTGGDSLVEISILSAEAL